MKQVDRFPLGVLVITVVTAVVASGLFLVSQALFAAEPSASAAVAPEVASWGMIAAAIATAASALGAAFAVAHVGAAAIGALAEKPELMGRILILVGLAEGIAIYGLIVAILILNRLG